MGAHLLFLCEFSFYKQCRTCRLDLVYVHSKRGNKVPILLTAEVKHGIEALISTCGVAGVHEENKYVFAAPKIDYEHCLHGSEFVSAVLKRCHGLEFPVFVQST